MPAPPGTKKRSNPTRQDEASRDLSAEVEELQAEIVALRQENAELRPAATERKQAEEALRESEKLFRGVQESSPDGFVMLEPVRDDAGKIIDFVWTYLNGQAERFNRVGHEELLEKRLLEMRPEHEKGLFDAYVRVMETGEPLQQEFHYQGDGFNFLTRLKATRVGDSLALSLLDLTDRLRVEEALRESEEKYRGLFTSMSEAFGLMNLIHNKDGRVIDYVFLDVNPAWEQMSGIKREDAVGRNAKNLFGMVEDYWLEMFDRVNRTGEPERLEEYGGGMGRYYSVIAWKAGEDRVAHTFTDITERKWAEAELQRSETLYRSIAQNFPNGAIYVFDRDLRFLIVEGRGLEPIGWSKTALEGKTVQELDTETAEILEPRYRGVLAGETQEYETNYRGRTMLSRYVPLRDVQGNVELGMVVSLDITKRKQAKEALRVSEERFRIALQNSPITVATFDKDLRYTWAYNTRHGFRADDVIGKRPDEIIPPEEAAGQMAIMRHVLETGISERREASDTTHGIPRIFDFTVEPLRNEAGELIGLNMAAIDITERKRAEEAKAADLTALTKMHDLSGKLLDSGGLQSLLQEIMETAIAIIGADKGTLQLVEGASLHIVTAYGHQQQFLDFFAAAEQQTSVCGRAMKDRARVIVTDVEESDLFAGTPSLSVFRKADVRSIQSTPLVSRSGMLMGILTTQWSVPYVPDEHDLWRLDLLARQAADLIEIARTEEALRRQTENLTQLQRELVAANREANLYLDILTHDIGNTENVSNLYADLLIDSLQGKEVGYVKKLQRSVQKSIEILKTVSTIRRIHQESFELKPMDLNAVIRGVTKDFPCSTILCDGLHYRVWADDLLSVIFNNLISNAVKHGGPEVVVAVRVEDAGETILVSVEDTGPGVPDDQKEAIFRCYEQKRRGVGEGLGLYLVQILVERYGGKVWVEDRVPGRPEEGAAFRFTLQKAA